MNIEQIKYAVERGIRYENGNIIGLRGKPLKPRKGGKGYKVVALPTPTGFLNEYVHRLVYYFETGDVRVFDNNYEIHHNNGIRHDNRIGNLKLMGAREHESLSSKGNTHNAKIDYDTAQQIRTRYAKGGISQTDLAKEYDLSQQHVSDIIRGKKWGDIHRRK